MLLQMVSHRSGRVMVSKFLLAVHAVNKSLNKVAVLVLAKAHMFPTETRAWTRMRMDSKIRRRHCNVVSCVSMENMI
jgi:hypothetical protein